MDRAFRINEETLKALHQNRFEYESAGREMKKNFYNNFDSKLIDIKEEIKDSNYLDMTKIEEEWFPEIGNGFDIFISHSHRDIDKITRIAGLLKKEFQLTCFVDSWLWGHADKVLDAINDKYSIDKKEIAYKKNGAWVPSKNKLYYHNLSKKTTSLVDAALTSALIKSLYKTRCMLFVESDNSLEKPILKKDGDYTKSPWIYLENVAYRFVEKQKISLSEHEQRSSEGMAMDSAPPPLNPLMKLDLSKYDLITSTHIQQWRQSKWQGGGILSTLYKIVDNDKAPYR